MQPRRLFIHCIGCQRTHVKSIYNTSTVTGHCMRIQLQSHDFTTSQNRIRYAMYSTRKFRATILIARPSAQRYLHFMRGSIIVACTVPQAPFNLVTVSKEIPILAMTCMYNHKRSLIEHFDDTCSYINVHIGISLVSCLI